MSVGDLEAWDKKPSRPALRVLQDDQAELLESLLEGFETLVDVVEWYQSAAVRTFGYIEEYLEPTQLLADRALVRALTGGETRRSDRTRYAYGTLHAPCNRAYVDLRERSGEYVAESSQGDYDELDLDPSRQRFLAMRPAHSELDARQREALLELWRGFDDASELLTWVLGLQGPTHGEIDEELARELLRSDHAAEVLLADELTDAVAADRVRFAIGVLLPAFNAGAAELTAGEQAETGGEPQGADPL